MLILETNYTQHTDIQYYVKNNFITMLTTLILNTRYTFITDYADFRDDIQHIKITLPVTMLTTLISNTK